LVQELLGDEELSSASEPSYSPRLTAIGRRSWWDHVDELAHRTGLVRAVAAARTLSPLSHREALERL
jgi:hypothetical protein